MVILYIILAGMCIALVVLFTVAIKNTIRKERELAEFRFRLQIGDMTNEGEVISINKPHQIVTKKISHINGIKPYQDENLDN